MKFCQFCNRMVDSLELCTCSLSIAQFLRTRTSMDWVADVIERQDKEINSLKHRLTELVREKEEVEKEGIDLFHRRLQIRKDMFPHVDNKLMMKQGYPRISRLIYGS